MSHDELAGLAAGYTLSALDADDLQLFEAHLASCPECQASVADLRQLVDCFSLMTDEAEPAAALRDRIMASVSAEPRHPEPAGTITPLKAAPWWRRPVLWPLTVAAVMIVLAVAVAVVSVWGSQTNDDLSSAQSRLDLTYDGLEIIRTLHPCLRHSRQRHPASRAQLQTSRGGILACPTTAADNSRQGPALRRLSRMSPEATATHQ